jgi:hypothetical protein
MECRRCASPLEKPGDYCLVCDTGNADAVVVEAGTDAATLTVLREEAVVGETTVTTTPESGGELGQVQVRNFAGRIADHVRRKRPERVYATGDRETIRALRADLHHQVRRVTGEDPVASVIERRGETPLDVVEATPGEKIGGAHSTVIADREGHRVLLTVADHPHVKKVVPGPIDAGGGSTRGGVRAKVTRADANGNVRLLLRDGSSVQENRVVTTATDRADGERVREDLNGALGEADLA